MTVHVYRKVDFIMGRYIITNGENFIGVAANSNIIKVESIYDAKVFSSPDRCKNVIRNNLLTEMQDWYYAQISDTEEINWNEKKGKQIIIHPNKPVKKTTVDNYIEKLKEIADEVDLKYLNLKSDLDVVEKEIVDIYHAIEFYDLSESKGYEIYKMLQERLQHRREIKNELEKISIILGTNIQKESIKNAKEKIRGMETRTYVPRVMIDLFT